MTAKIICVEDEAHVREGIVEELKDAGYDVLEATDGKHGLEMIVEHKPDLIISDITMPRMDGHQMLKELRANHCSLADVPLIFLSALADRKDIVDGVNLGADDYLTKPIDLDLLLSKVQASLRQTKRIAAKNKMERNELVMLATQVIKKKDEENEKLSQALTAKTNGENPWMAPNPARITLVGEGEPGLFEIQRFLEEAGHAVRVFTSGRTYLENVRKVPAQLTLLWMHSDDLTAQKVFSQLTIKNGRYILVAPSNQASASVKNLQRDFNDTIYLPISRETLFEKVTAQV